MKDYHAYKMILTVIEFIILILACVYMVDLFFDIQPRALLIIVASGVALLVDYLLTMFADYIVRLENEDEL